MARQTERTPSNLQNEIDKHEEFIFKAEMFGMYKRQVKTHKKYVAQLKKELMEITDPGEDISDLSDADLLAELGL